MPDFGIEVVQNIHNPQVAQEWEIQFLRTPAGVNLEDATYRVLSTGLPETTINMGERRFMGQAFKVPFSHANHGQIQVTFEEDDLGFVIEQFVNWRNFIKDPQTGQGGTRRLRDMKCEVYIQMLNRAHEASARAYRLFGVMPEVIQGTELSYEGDETLQRPVTLSYDTWDLAEQGVTARVTASLG